MVEGAAWCLEKQICICGRRSYYCLGSGTTVEDGQTICGYGTPRLRQRSGWVIPALSLDLLSRSGEWRDKRGLAIMLGFIHCVLVYLSIMRRPDIVSVRKDEVITSVSGIRPDFGEVKYTELSRAVRVHRVQGGYGGLTSGTCSASTSTSSVRICLLCYTPNWIGCTVLIV
jgi:hypothetical protein